MSPLSDDRSHATSPRRIAGRLAAWAFAALASLTHAQSAPQPLLMVEQGAHGAPVRRIDVDPTRSLAVTASDDRTARVWDTASGELRHVLRPQAF